eukprot:TRINITY_DN18337_c0_g2_i1.p1 TRINITY_DN18337_c0_g2~~TRINITY_DN18337_c0_g2_i1.p1  ORF type:complete len:724 (+),score=97.68 TRINITY_DN18337_c0_g2_i1:134-2173(+)
MAAGEAAGEKLDEGFEQKPSGVFILAPFTLPDASEGFAREKLGSCVPLSSKDAPRRLDLDLNRLDPAVNRLQGEGRVARDCVRGGISEAAVVGEVWGKSRGGQGGCGPWGIGGTPDASHSWNLPRDATMGPPATLAAAAPGGGYGVTAGASSLPPAREPTWEGRAPVGRGKRSAMADIDLNAPAAGLEGADLGESRGEPLARGLVPVVPGSSFRATLRSVLYAKQADHPSFSESLEGSHFSTRGSAAESPQRPPDLPLSQLPPTNTSWEATAGVDRLVASQSAAAARQCLLLSSGLNPTVLPRGPGSASTPSSSALHDRDSVSHLRSDPASASAAIAASAAPRLLHDLALLPSGSPASNSLSYSPPCRPTQPSPTQLDQTPFKFLARTTGERSFLEATQQFPVPNLSPNDMFSGPQAVRATAPAQQGRAEAAVYSEGWNRTSNPNTSFNSTVSHIIGDIPWSGRKETSSPFSKLPPSSSERLKGDSSLAFLPPSRAYVPSAALSEQALRFSRSVRPGTFSPPVHAPSPAAGSPLPSFLANQPSPFPAPPISFSGPSSPSRVSPSPFRASSISEPSLPSPSVAKIAAFFANTLKAVSSQSSANLGPSPSRPSLTAAAPPAVTGASGGSPNLPAIRREESASTSRRSPGSDNLNMALLAQLQSSKIDAFVGMALQMQQRLR